MKARHAKVILLFSILVLAVSMTSCTRKRKDFNTAKNAVARELQSPDTARFCVLNDANFSVRNGVHAVKLWVDNRNLAGTIVRTHFEVTIDAKSGLVTDATCLECAAEDEKQELNKAMAELQALTSPSEKSSTTSAQPEKPEN